MLGTNKTKALRLEQYSPRQDISKMIVDNAHPARFENINKLPKVHSQFKKALELTQFNKCITRKQASPDIAMLEPLRADCGVSSYSPDIPKYYEGQPGYKKNTLRLA